VQAVRGLHLLTMPLTPLRLTGVAGSLILLATGYCLAHGLVIDDELNLPRTLWWAVASTTPWVFALEVLKRLGARPERGLRMLLSSAVLIAALLVSAALEYALSAIYPVDTDSFGAILYRLLPVLVGVAAVRFLLQPSRPARPDAGSPAERLRESQIERVLNVQTRLGMLSVRTCDIEYVRSAGNYVELITSDRTLLMRMTLHDLGEQLRAVGFVRVHRSLLVNALHVVAIGRGSRGRRVVKMRGGAELPVGRQFDDTARAFDPAPPS
jgi:DNA-binding LytR/AlgR family response regulator